MLLGWLADHGVLTTEQIAAGLFPSVNFAQRRLRELMSKQLIDRFRPQRPDGGSYPYHWVLAQLGSDVMASQRGEPMPRRDHARLRRWHLTSRANLPHLLGVNEFFTQLAAHARTHPGAALSRWWSAARCQQAGAFTGHVRSGGRVDGTALAYRPTVRPDGHGIFTDQGASTAFFLEYDTGTEPLSRLVGKVGGYHDLARVTGRLWPVLFWLPGPARERHLHDALNSARTGYPTATAVHGHSGRAPATDHRVEEPGHPAGPVWWLHQHRGGALTLAELSTAITDLARDAA
ncbi:replication-relaxation family protein [Jidongwangia harbinensis]|uniref:replication-relaxation family protein n=1 Tax=Jidongwangia harbinensis TaxID=2878561 RepID=UPI001CD9B442|nr:replication-relaxation family protein [Jidongwangia harbinensis]MCA2216902.1 replication-relaxation family protein [Jidongwangia harbinensis]